MKDCDEDRESLYLKYSDANNLHGWTVSQKLSVGGFEQVKNTSPLNKYFIKNYSENTEEEYFLEVEIKYTKILLVLHGDSFTLPERMKIENIEKPVANLQDKKQYIKINLKQALNHGLILKKVHKVIEFNQKS